MANACWLDAKGLDVTGAIEKTADTMDDLYCEVVTSAVMFFLARRRKEERSG